MLRTLLFTDPSNDSPKWRKALPYALLMAAAAALYLPSLGYGFVWDDVSYIVENYRLQGLSALHLHAMWAYSYSGQYAPLHQTFLALLYSIFELNPFGYHLAQIVLHAACAGLAFFVLKEIEAAPVAFAASALFAIHPANVETVAWVSECKSTLALLFFLLSFHYFLRSRESGKAMDGARCVLLLVLSLLFKINIVVAPAVFLLYEYRRGYAFKKIGGWTIGLSFAVCLLFAAYTILSTAGSSAAFPDRLVDGALREIGSVHRPDSGGYYGGPLVHILNLPRLFFFYVRMVVFPYPLSPWHMVWIFERLNAVAVVSWLAMMSLPLALYRCGRETKFWALWFVVFLAPVLQIFPNPVWVSERYLYVPAIGAFVLLARTIFYLSGRMPERQASWILPSAAAAIALAFSLVTWNSLPAWRNEIALWTHATERTCKASAYCHDKLGNALVRGGRVDEGATELQEAVRLRPGPQYLIDLGNAFTDYLGDYPRGREAYNEALRIAGAMPAFYWGQVAKNYYLAGDLATASRIVEEIRKRDVDDPGMLLVDGFIQWKRGNREPARKSLQRLIALNSLYPRTANTAERFLGHYWHRTDEVSRLLAEIGPL